MGECGCCFALVSYDSVASVNTAQQVLKNGRLGISKSGNKTLVLASEPALVADKDTASIPLCARLIALCSVELNRTYRFAPSTAFL
ncbi:MAG TPA: hypothetical protein DD666_04855 [Advenella kashmirensis]|uniref:Uncharacterized protein n=1 Tax=Advenella kashmirensis TaxID=310575 RepID=A0A356LCJ9_9BURK|nr:hypothetical protein [Advenella kashmirensis]